jgi:hypothetical protein
MMSSGDMICISSFMTIGSSIQAILTLFPRKFEGFMKYTVEMASGGVPSFIEIGSDVKKLLSGD